ncbi:MAG: DUF2156 domain-containing protein [Candidatus Aminicenantes bacterium]|nr:DUF2156 domain-containing protein [Candidatus Aminicenantes bacterium]
MSQGEVHDPGEALPLSLPEYPDMRPLALEDRDDVQAFFSRFPAEANEGCFGNHYIWRHYDRPRVAVLNGNLVLFFTPPHEPAYFLPPVGETDIPGTIEACLAHTPRLSRVPAAFAEKYCPGFRCAPDRNDFDYVYATADLAELKGKRYDGKRNRIRKLEREHSWAYRALTADLLPDCRRLFEEWLAEQGEPTPMSSAQGKVIREALLHYEALELTGGAIEIDGQIAAISIGERLNPSTAVIHIEIASPCCEGLAQLMNREFVRNAWPDTDFINRESDLGLPGLRKAKLSYHPHHMVEKFHIWK